MTARACLKAFIAFIAIIEFSTGSNAQPAPAEAPCRIGKMLFKMPDGWQRKTTPGGITHLAMSNSPQGQWIEIRLLAPQEMKGTLKEFLAGQIGIIRGTFPGVQEGQAVELRHPGGYDTAFTTVTMASDTSGRNFLYTMIYVPRVAGQGYPIIVISNNAELYNSARPMLEKFLNTLSFTPLMKLADGDPPLTQALVDEVGDFLEWLMDVPFTDGQKQTVREELTASWKKQDKEEINGVKDMQNARMQLSAMTADQRALAREKILQEAIKQWRSQNDRAAKMMVGIYDAGHKPIAEGQPPLTRQTADASMELLLFIASQVAGIEATSPTPQQKDQYVAKLAETYPKLDANAREELSQVPMTWAALRVAWSEASEADKQKLREQWSSRAEVKQVAEGLKKMREQTASAAPGGAVTPASIQQSYTNYNNLSNASMQLFTARMNSIATMGGSNLRYEYRYH